VLGLYGRTPYLFNVENLELLSTLAEQLGVAVENARLRERAAAAIVLEERQRLARDLHDSVTQLLYSQTLFASAAVKSLQAGQAERTHHYLTRLDESARYALREMRLLIYRLRPAVLAETGLAGALQRRLEMVERRAGIQVSFMNKLPQALPAEVERALYHIAEEALNNILKHANASEVQVALCQEETAAMLSVRDNGRGFELTAISHGLGLQSLQERAEELGGTITLDSEPGVGTCLLVRIPLGQR
jgi:signal transduction histidine kinase